MGGTDDTMRGTEEHRSRNIDLFHLFADMDYQLGLWHCVVQRRSLPESSNYLQARVTKKTRETSSMQKY
jgi:hypothetical protein